LEDIFRKDDNVCLDIDDHISDIVIKLGGLVGYFLTDLKPEGGFGIGTVLEKDKFLGKGIVGQRKHEYQGNQGYFGFEKGTFHAIGLIGAVRYNENLEMSFILK